MENNHEQQTENWAGRRRSYHRWVGIGAGIQDENEASTETGVGQPSTERSPYVHLEVRDQLQRFKPMLLRCAGPTFLRFQFSEDQAGRSYEHFVGNPGAERRESNVWYRNHPYHLA